MASPVLIDIPEELHGSQVLVRPYRAEDAPFVWEAVEETRENLAPWLPWVHQYRVRTGRRRTGISLPSSWRITVV